MIASGGSPFIYKGSLHPPFYTSSILKAFQGRICRRPTPHLFIHFYPRRHLDAFGPPHSLQPQRRRGRGGGGGGLLPILLPPPARGRVDVYARSARLRNGQAGRNGIRIRTIIRTDIHTHTPCPHLSVHPHAPVWRPRAASARPLGPPRTAARPSARSRGWASGRRRT